MTIDFVKAHGAANDFLLVLRPGALAASACPALARAICDRRRGVGADGLILFTGPLTIRLFNSDGSEAELSGNGTRCAAAVLVAEGLAGDDLSIRTGAGEKRLQLCQRQGDLFQFDMWMGRPAYSSRDLDFPLETSSGIRPVTILDVGNPQCAVLVESFEFDWRRLAREVESHPRFPRRTNVSIVRPVDDHAIEARFYGRGAGETMSSGTGAAGAAVAAILAGRAMSPVRVVTPAGDLDVRWDEELVLRGPAEITARGRYYWAGSSAASLL